MHMNDSATKQFLRELKHTLLATDQRLESLQKAVDNAAVLEKSIADLLTLVGKQRREIDELNKFKREMTPWIPVLRELKERLDEWKAESAEDQK
jgi:hypothetical protein